ncbi:Gtr1/RagA G protein conserved region-domain-containing protein [Suillus cothurnatus]|nr:Gtr1/RagA G protein conserved region-domain-containing protein [Suillus cothurnatus]
MNSSSSAAIFNGTIRRKKILFLVLFDDPPVKQTFYLEPTMRVAKHFIECALVHCFRSTVILLEIWDCPGNVTVDTLGTSLADFSTTVFVIDIRDLYQHPVPKLVEFIVAACQIHPDINFEVFVHKAERLQEDDKIENFRQIRERVMNRLVDESPEFEQFPLNFHLTSIYDHSLREAFSRNTASPKAFLFDTSSKIHVATDTSPVDQATHNLCCDYLSMLNSFGPLYRSNSNDPRTSRFSPTPAPTPPPTATTSTPTSGTSPTGTPPLTSPSSPVPPSKPHFYPSAATSLSPSRPGTTLTYHLVTPHLALLALLPTTVYDMRRGLVEWNVVWFREGVREIWESGLRGSSEL